MSLIISTADVDSGRRASSVGQRKNHNQEEITMYQMDPAMPRQMYAEFVQSREQDRLARRVARHNKRTRTTAHRHTPRRVVPRRMKHTQVA
jgi:hypothetical protein